MAIRKFRALDMRDRALVRAILATALRFRGTIDALIAARLERPLPAKRTTLSHILHVGAAQILFLDIPDSAAVDLAVTHAKSDPRTARFSGLVNGVLRGIARDKAARCRRSSPSGDDAPGMVPRPAGRRLWTRSAQAILAAHRVEAAGRFHGEVGSAALGGGTRRHRAADRLGAGRASRRAGRRTARLRGRRSGGCRTRPQRCRRGCSAMSPGRRVADLCAAPGGKTAQLVLAGAVVTAVDSSRNRLARLGENLDGSAASRDQSRPTC